MNPDLHERAGRIFLKTLELPSDERATFLDKTCGSDLELLREVESLLASDASKLNLENISGLDVRVGVTDLGERVSEQAHAAPEEMPERIGPYTCISELGSGGFGVVYSAEQQEPVRRRVALKIIKLGMDTKEVMARFDIERQALAMMDHPNIARVYDAGATETGRPFFVMELVDGVPVTRFCDAENMDTRSRLGLFIEICHAIQHAHQKGIIHRDIKPNNVLVTQVDGRPVPKVIDFGIAKAMDVESAEHMTITRQYQMLGTPAYMSPEQADMSGLDIDTRSDVYALGVLMYELMTGTTPFSSETLRLASFSEVLRIIREEEPHRPSTRLSSLGRELTTVANQRRTDARRLPTLIRGDLDWIVMKALEKDRTRRYETASDFARDIQRYLDDEPVLASPPRTSDRIVKFVRRHRVGVLAGSIVVLALVACTVGVSISLVRAVRAERKATGALVRTKQAEATAIAEGDRARRAASEAGAVNQFLQQMLAEANPRNNPAGREMTVPEMLDGAAAKIDGAFPDQPMVDAAVRIAIGTAYRELGRWDEAIKQLAAAAELQRDLDPELWCSFECQNQLGATYLNQGRYEPAEATLKEALATARARLGSQHHDVATLLTTLGSVYLEKTDFDAAEECCREALAIYRKSVGNDHVDTNNARSVLGGILYRKREYAEAEPLFREALEAARREHGDAHPAVADAANNLAVILRYESKFDEAERYYREAGEIGKRAYGDEHPFVATSLNNLARLYHKRGDFEAAEPLYRESLAMRRRVLPADHFQIAEVACNLAELLDQEGKLEESAVLFREGLDMERRIFGDQHQYVGQHATALGIVLRKSGKLSEAEPLLREALAIYRKAYPNTRVETARTSFELATVLLLRGDAEAAKPLVQEGLEGSRTAHAAGDARAIPTLIHMGRGFVDIGAWDAAELTLRESLALHTVSVPDRLTGMAKLHLGRCLTSLSRFDDAEVLLKAANGILANSEDQNRDSDMILVARAFVSLYEAWGKPEEAAEWRAKLPPATSQSAEGSTAD